MHALADEHKSGRKDDHFKLRIDPPLRQWIKIQAARNNRSMTGEILWALNGYRSMIDAMDREGSSPSK